MVPPKTTLAISRWMLTGIQVKLLTACHKVPVNCPASPISGLGGRDHERHPGVRDEEDRGAEEVGEDAQPHVDPLAGARQPVPAVVPEVDDEGLQEEQRGVEPHARREDRAHVGPELRVEGDQEEEEQPAQERGRREGREGELHELVGQPVEAPPLGRVEAGPPGHDLDDDGEDRHAQDERGEVEVDLGDDPHRQPRADVGEGAVGRLARLGRRRLGAGAGRQGAERGADQEGQEEKPGQRPAVARHQSLAASHTGRVGSSVGMGHEKRSPPRLRIACSLDHKTAFSL